MKISAIDVGSNSVRLMVMADGKTLYKQTDTTRLGEGLAASGRLLPEAIVAYMYIWKEGLEHPLHIRLKK